MPDITIGQGSLDGNVFSFADLYAREQLENFGTQVNRAVEASDGKIDDAYVEDGYLYMTANGQVTVGPLGPFSGGGGGSDTGSTMRLTNTTGSTTLTVIENVTTCNLSVTWSSVDTDTSTATGNGTATWMVNGSRVAVQSIAQGAYSYNIRSHLTDGTTNTVRLTIEDSYGNSRSLAWQVTVTAFTLTWNLSEVNYHGSNGITLRLLPVGAGTKTIHVTLDGTSIYSESTDASGRAVSVSVAAQNHGSHVITAWMDATIDGVLVSTPVLRHCGIWSQDGYTAPVIAVSETAATISQYATHSIQYMVYDPAGETATVTRAVDGTTDAIITADRTPQVWAYRATVSGTKSLTLTCGATTATITLTVESMDQAVSEVEGAVIDIDPTGHSNNEAGYNNFGYKDENGTVHTFSYSSNFDWTGGGFQQDSDGVTAFVVKRGTYIRLDRSLFNDNARTNGKEIKMVFKAVGVRDYDAELMNCVANGIGLTVKAQSATLTSSLESLDALYCEGQKIELDINIEPTSENRFATLWLEGVISRCKVYGTDDSWMQATPSTLKIGSDDCDVWLYRLKMYDTNLTRYEILDNFIADCSDPDEMQARYNRNNIYGSGGGIDINKLANARPNLRIIRISADRITTGKRDPVTTRIQHIYLNGDANDNWTAVGAVHKAQGTSSLDYALAALNLDIDMAGSTWTNANGETMTSYAMTDNSVPVSYFNIKLNVASSENANNVLLADDYNTYQPWLSPARQANSKIRDTVEGHPCAVFFTNTSRSTITVGSHSVAPGETIFYGNGDMNNSKKNTAVFGQDTSQWSQQCCIEILNNNNAQCKFKSDDLTNEGWGDNSTDSFEFRYGESDAAKAKLQELLTWMVSVDASAATGDALGVPVTINGTVYANDTAAYRGAKFRDEIGDYFAVDSVLYHYLFTERHCMVDNRAKNCFISYEYDSDQDKYLWNFCKDYDNDTGMGNDNSGGLTFTYGLEDTDRVGEAMVFNASDSALWCMVRDYMQPELTAMFQSRESAGAWSASRIIEKFETYQSARPEALVNEDMYAKYITPYLASGETRYFSMLYGNKTDQRRQFQTYQEKYMASKYGSALAVSDSIEFRANTPTTYAGVTPSGDMVITPYSDLYVSVRYGNAGTVKVRAQRGVATTITCPASDLNDTETYVYSASMVSGLTGLAGLYTKLAQLSRATRLTRLELGSGEAGYSNTSLESISFGSNPMLEYIDLRGTPNLVQALDLSGLNGLRELYLTNSGVTGVTFAVGAIVETALLPTVLSLTAIKLVYLQTLTCSASRITRLWVEETPVIDTYAICSAAANLASGRLIDVNWTCDDPDTVLRLATLGGIDANGNDTATFVLTGSVYIAGLSADELTTIRTAFPNLTVTYGEILPAYTVTFEDYDGTTLYTESVRSGGNAVDPVQAGYISAPTRPSSVDTIYAYRGWDTGLTNITENTTITAAYATSTRMYTVTWMYDAATVLYSETVEALSEVTYDGASHSCPEVLTPPASGQLWTGWDTSTSSIVADTTVIAVFVTPTMPSVKPNSYDYLYSDDPEDDSAYTLAEFWGVIYNGEIRNYFDIGDKVKMLTNSTDFGDREIVFQLEAYKHYKTADGTEWANGVFGMVGVMNTTRAIHGSSAGNQTGWIGCRTRAYLNETVYPAFSQKWKSIIKKAQVLTNAGAGSSEITATEDYIFLRSVAEMGTASYYTEVPYIYEVASGADEVVYSLYTSNASRVKYFYNGAGSASNYLLRSPMNSGTQFFAGVQVEGTHGNYNMITAAGVSFCFCV